MNNFVNDGTVVQLTAPYNVASGAGAKVGHLFGVATGTFLSGALGEFMTKGRFLLTSDTGASWAVGDPIYWDDTNKWTTKTSSGNSLIGVAAAVKGSSAVVGDVRLNGVGF